ncbi:FAD-dependent monooxygenase [Nocardia abscessus]|uniref:FAD-dependent monooxygenase n=1 Tax=Nocardia abscessus TaxID=120957 RepID=A0ABS0C375_9NOCA|nr:FAD-dependent monooxygenase [Nocardia abscessus]MBF6224195.1 FAD-dependent monooxygenase [Nocardia abscessus]
MTIVGAGSTGCTLALLLARYGIASTVLERRTEVLNHPAATILNARSQEIWHHASPELAGRIAALAPPPEEIATIRWYTDLSSPRLGEIDLLAFTEQVERVKSHSRFLISHIGQQQLMAVLWDVVDADPLVNVRRGVQVQRVSTTPAGATVRAVAGVDPAGGIRRSLRPERPSVSPVTHARHRMAFGNRRRANSAPVSRIRPLRWWRGVGGHVPCAGQTRMQMRVTGDTAMPEPPVWPRECEGSLVHATVSVVPITRV